MSETKNPTSPMPYADVAVNLPVSQTYTYKIPDGLRPLIAPGRMVRVPVRKRQVEGVVVALTDKTDAPKNRLKPIEKVLTPDYHIAPDLMALGRWMSGYYLAGPGESLASIAFFGLSDEKPRREQRYRLAHFADDDSDTELPEALMDDTLTEAQRDVVRCLEEELNAPMTQAELCRRSGRSASVVKTLEDKGVLTAETYEQERDDQYSRGREALATRHQLTDEQQAAFDKIASAIDEPRFESFLLYGITGSGKTEVYLQAIDRVLAAGRQAIVLVPEISLTPQAVERFRSRFGDHVGVYHSHLTRGQKFDLWRQIESGEITVLIGARSAVFAPFKQLGLVVVDEEHEHSYKQSDPAPRYHARDVGVWRARQFGVPAILGSATPSLESLLNARPDLDEDNEREAKYTWLALEKRAGGASLPDIELIDMAAGVRDERHTGLLSERLEKAIGKRLEKGEQSILFLNRRGFSNFLLCLSCKTAIRCPHCDVVMTWHKSIHSLMCHFCGEQQPKPAKCPECDTPDPAPMGAGTQRIEEDVQKAFPDARVLRIDLDTTRGKHGFLRLWEQIERGDADILLGTQMIAKGLHLERVTLVGVVSADHSLFLPDFRASERAFAQLTQVAGRAGRMADRGGEVIIQTFVPHHYAIQRAIHHDTNGFWKTELHMRTMLRFPPCWRLLLVRISGEKPDKVRVRATRLGALLKDIQFKNQDYRGLGILGPVPCPIERLQDKTRWQIVIRGQSPALMRRMLQTAIAAYEKDKGRTGVNLTIDMDPLDLL